MQIKIIIFTLTTMTKVKQSDSNECWWEWGTARTLVHCWWKYKVVQPLWKTIPQFLKKKKQKKKKQENLYSQYGPMIPLLVIHSREIKMYMHTKICV